MVQSHQRNSAPVQRLFSRVRNKGLTETGNRARKVSGTQGKCNVASSYLYTQVQPAPANNDLSGFVVGNSSEFNQLVQSGNVKGATQLANAVLQSVEQSDTTATKEKIEVGDDVIPSYGVDNRKNELQLSVLPFGLDA